MDNINSADDMMQFVADMARRAVENRLSDEAEKKKIMMIEKLEELVFLVTGKHAEKDSIGFEISNDNPNALVPKNLYTLLIMNAVL